MKLTLKLTLIATSVMALVLTALATWTIRLEADLLEADTERDAALIALSLAHSGVGSRALQAVDRGLTARAPGELKVSMTTAREEGLTGGERELMEGRVLLRRERRYGAEWVVAYALRASGGLDATEGQGSGRVEGVGPTTQLVRVAESLKPRDALQARLAWLNALAVLLTTLIGSGATLILGRRLVGRRIEALVEHSRRLGEGEYSHLNAIGGADELEELGAALNQLSADLERAERATEREARARLEAERTLMHVDRLRVVGEMAAGIAHEVGTPLAVVMGRAQLIMRRAAQGGGQGEQGQREQGQLLCERSGRDAEVIRAQSQRISDLVRQLLNYARVSEPRREPCDVAELLEQTRSLLSPIARKAGVELTPPALPPSPAYALVDPVLFGQAMTNVVMNAIQALNDPALPGRARKVSFWVHADVSPQGGQRWAISVRDTGPGFTHPERALGLFWTTKPPGEGSGLGLTIVERILTEHGGAVWVGNHAGGGAEVVLRWPACPPASAEPLPPPNLERPSESSSDDSRALEAESDL